MHKRGNEAMQNEILGASAQFTTSQIRRKTINQNKKVILGISQPNVKSTGSTHTLQQTTYNNISQSGAALANISQRYRENMTLNSLGKDPGNSMNGLEELPAHLLHEK